MAMELTTAHLLFMNIGVRYWDAAVEGFTEEQQKQVGNYVQNLEFHLRQGTGLFLWGNNSSGKTWISAALCKLVWGRYRMASYCVPAAILEEAWRDFNTEVPADSEGIESMARRVERVRFLVIDDLGKEHQGGARFATSKFTNLLQLRSRSRKTTMVTANMDPQELGNVYGSSMGRLAKECMIPIELSIEDLRQHVLEG